MQCSSASKFPEGAAPAQTNRARQAAPLHPAAESPGGSRRDFRFGALGRHLRRYLAKSPSPAAADGQTRCVFVPFRACASHILAAGGYLAPANEAFTSGLRML
jgi:hypothetical protein